MIYNECREYGLTGEFMARSSTTFSSTHQPKNRKNRNERTRLVEAMGRNGYTEEQFYDKIMEIAFSDDGMAMMRDILIRMSPAPKSTMPCYEFEFDDDASYAVQANQIIKAASQGIIPPDVASLYIASLSNMLKITEITELEERINKLEATADEQD